MRQAIWALLGFAGLIWSGLAWLLYSVAGAGGVAVTRVTDWLDLDPGATQWLAEGLTMAGGIAQFLVGGIWVLGLLLLAAVGLLVNRAKTSFESVSRHSKFSYGGQSVEGEIKDRSIY